MTDIVNYHYKKTIYADIPGGGITVEYFGKAEIITDLNGNEVREVKILTVNVFVNKQKDPFATMPPEEYAQEFFSNARIAALQAYREKRAEIQ